MERKRRDPKGFARENLWGGLAGLLGDTAKHWQDFALFPRRWRAIIGVWTLEITRREMAKLGRDHIRLRCGARPQRSEGRSDPPLGGGVSGALF